MIKHAPKGYKQISIRVLLSIGLKLFRNVHMHAVQLFIKGHHLRSNQLPSLTNHLQLLKLLHLDKCPQIFIEDPYAVGHRTEVPLDAKKMVTGLINIMHAFLNHRRDLFSKGPDVLPQAVPSIVQRNDPMFSVLTGTVHATGTQRSSAKSAVYRQDDVVLYATRMLRVFYQGLSQCDRSLYRLMKGCSKGSDPLELSNVFCRRSGGRHDGQRTLGAWVLSHGKMTKNRPK